MFLLCKYYVKINFFGSGWPHALFDTKFDHDRGNPPGLARQGLETSGKERSLMGNWHADGMCCGNATLTKWKLRCADLSRALPLLGLAGLPV